MHLAMVLGSMSLTKVSHESLPAVITVPFYLAWFMVIHYAKVMKSWCKDISVIIWWPSDYGSVLGEVLHW